MRKHAFGLFFPSPAPIKKSMLHVTITVLALVGAFLPFLASTGGSGGV